MTTIQLHIPDDLADKLGQLTPDAEAYILALLRSHVQDGQVEHHLAQEYQLAAEENKQLTQDFTTIDQENWGDDY